MSLIKLANGHKYEIEQPNEGEGMMRNRRRNTVQLTFRADAEQFDAIRAKETSKAPAVYGRQLSVTLGERLASDI